MNLSESAQLLIIDVFVVVDNEEDDVDAANDEDGVDADGSDPAGDADDDELKGLLKE